MSAFIPCFTSRLPALAFLRRQLLPQPDLAGGIDVKNVFTFFNVFLFFKRFFIFIKRWHLQEFEIQWIHK